MGRESIEEGELSTPLVAKEEHHQLYGSGTSSGDHACANTTGCDDGGESQSGSSLATGVVVLSTLVAVSGSYVFGIAVGYSSPAQSGILDDLGLTVAEIPLFELYYMEKEERLCSENHVRMAISQTRFIT
uniref:Uncharacterized protein n=1 Tax=Quercus lobata TaxID=97700 RepID=A0A7N2L475_QUELO